MIQKNATSISAAFDMVLEEVERGVVWVPAYDMQGFGAKYKGIPK